MNGDEDYRECCGTLGGAKHEPECSVISYACEVCKGRHFIGTICPEPGVIRTKLVPRKPLAIFVPEELDPIRADLQRFFDAMIFKLRANAHKGRWADMTVKQCLPKLKAEVVELGAAIKEGSSAEVLMEAADVANWSMITANVALEAKGV